MGIFGACGINCENCDAFKATKNNDDAFRKETAEKWSKEYNHEFKPEDVNCDGCMVEGRHLGYCSQCGVRKCVLEHKLESCAQCSEYPCNTVSEFHKMTPPEVKEHIETEHKKIFGK